MPQPALPPHSLPYHRPGINQQRPVRNTCVECHERKYLPEHELLDGRSCIRLGSCFPDGYYHMLDNLRRRRRTSSDSATVTVVADTEMRVASTINTSN